MSSGKLVMAYVEALTGMDIDFGRVLWHALREDKKFPTNGALWLFQSESGEGTCWLRPQEWMKWGRERHMKNWRGSRDAFPQIRSAF